MSEERTPYELAAERMRNEPALHPYIAIIMYDWPQGDEHWTWVASAPVAEIVDWALDVVGNDWLPEEEPA